MATSKDNLGFDTYEDTWDIKWEEYHGFNKPETSFQTMNASCFNQNDFKPI